jgi:hypothetical protein
MTKFRLILNFILAVQKSIMFLFFYISLHTKMMIISHNSH